MRVDPTFGIEPADATHITLAVGDARCILRAADLVGAVRLHLLSVQPQSALDSTAQRNREQR